MGIGKNFWNVVDKVVRGSDLVIEVLDSRMPQLSQNRKLGEMIRRNKKPHIKVFAKMDLVSVEFLKNLKKMYFEGVFISSRNHEGFDELNRRIIEIKRRNNIEDMKIGIVGYPNIGKSMLANGLAERAKTIVSPVAGTTRGRQTISAADFKIIDTPGVIPFEDDEVKLGILAAKNPESLYNPEKVAIEIIKMFILGNRVSFEKKYGVKIKEENVDYEQVLMDIGRRRGFLKKGGEVDSIKTSIHVVREWQTGKLKF